MLLGLAGAAIEIAPDTMDSVGSAVEAAAAADNKNSRGGARGLQGRRRALGSTACVRWSCAGMRGRGVFAKVH
jgi:hypothetical protein